MRKITTVVLIGYDEKSETGELTNPVSYDILADTEAEAVEIAKKLYSKPNFRLKGFVEFYTDQEAVNKTVFFISCFVESDPMTRMYKDHVAVQVYAENGDEALARAKAIVDKPFYKITDILQK